jgi:hypothetical protein
MSTDYSGQFQNQNSELSGTLQQKGRLDDFIKIYDQVVSDELCQRMIDLLSTDKKYYHDRDYLRREEVSVNPYVFPEVFEDLKNNVKEVYQRYKNDTAPLSSNLFQANTYEFPVVVGYKPSPDKKELFADHADSWHNDSATRQVSIIMYLSTVQEGGGTYFPMLDLRVQPVKGRVLLFPSYFMYMHRAEPPISDVKYVCISWMHFDGPTKYLSVKI